jgi:predicted RNase H-like HicB family nuclease
MPRTKVPHTFRVTYAHEKQPDGSSAWIVEIPSVQGCHTYGRSLSEARRNIREALACCSDVFEDPDAVARGAAFEEDIRLPRAVRSVLARSVRRRAQATAVATRAAAETRSAAEAITGAGLSLADAGELLGVSRQRVHAVLKAVTGKLTPRPPRLA